VSKRARRLPDRRIAVAAMALAVWLAAPHGGAAFRAAGRIEGRVLVSVPVAAPARSGAYAPRRVAGAAPPGPEVSNVVVFIKNAPKRGALPAMRATILQQNETFVPRVVAITTGSTVDFPNGDPFFHDVFSLSRSGPFDLGSYARGKSKTRTFEHAGLIKVYCHLHSHMTASIMVFDHPYFAIPAADGSFAIDDVPAGSFAVSAWHERIGDSTQPVTVESGRTSDLQFSLPIGSK
jgi:plastocyanin